MSTGRATAICLLGALGVGWLDYATGAEISVALLYLVPVLYVGWHAGYGTSVLIALVAAIAWLLADVANASMTLKAVTVWNGLTRLVIFVLGGVGAHKMRKDRDRLVSLASRLDNMRRREADLARTDPLTNLANRRGFLETLTREAARCRRSNLPFGLIYVDLDNFKTINDMHGHSAGDDLLRQIGEVIRNTVRTADVAGRLGGDEFVVLCWNTPYAALEQLAQRLVDRVKEMVAKYDSGLVGASAGAAWFEYPPEDAEEILKQADIAMYDAKRSGRGGLCIASPLIREDGPEEPHRQASL